MKELATALAAFQAEAPTVLKSKKAEVPTKSGGKYSYSYADLADVASAAYPLLAKHGLSFTCAPDLIDGRTMLRGTLLHSSGQSIDGLLPLQGSTAQEIGSAITYARRYLLGCLTGIVTDADDDGALASAAKRRPAKPEPQPEPVPIDTALRDAKQALVALVEEKQLLPQGALLKAWLPNQFTERGLDPNSTKDVLALITEWSQP